MIFKKPLFPKVRLVAHTRQIRLFDYSIICFAIFINNRISVGLCGEKRAASSGWDAGRAGGVL